MSSKLQFTTLLCLGVFLSACATGRKAVKDVHEVSFEDWVIKNHLVAATAEDAAQAKKSEVTFKKGHCNLGNGMTLKLHLGELIKLGSSRYSTTSYYELGDASGKSVAKYPSRFTRASSPDSDKDNVIRVWYGGASDGDMGEMLFVYECVWTTVDVQEFQFVLKREDYGWEAQGFAVPVWWEPPPPKPSVKTLGPGGVPIPVMNEGAGGIQPHGPDIEGLKNGPILFVPKRNLYFRFNPQGLEQKHPIPFIVG